MNIGLRNTRTRTRTRVNSHAQPYHEQTVITKILFYVLLIQGTSCFIKFYLLSHLLLSHPVLVQITPAELIHTVQADVATALHIVPIHTVQPETTKEILGERTLTVQPEEAMAQHVEPIHMVQQGATNILHLTIMRIKSYISPCFD